MIKPSRLAPLAAPVRTAALRSDKANISTGPLPASTSADPAKTGAELSPLAAAVKTLAASPPVDVAHVAKLRSAINAGSYRVDPQAIAAKMLLLDRGSRG